MIDLSNSEIPFIELDNGYLTFINKGKPYVTFASSYTKFQEQYVLQVNNRIESDHQSYISSIIPIKEISPKRVKTKCLQILQNSIKKDFAYSFFKDRKLEPNQKDKRTLAQYLKEELDVSLKNPIFNEYINR